MRKYCLGLILVLMTSLAFADSWQQQHDAVVGQLKFNRVQVIEQGQNVAVILPAASLFPQHSPRLLPEAKRPLDCVGDFLKLWHKTAVKVASYTDDEGTTKRNMALSQHRAEVVADYLWRYGSDTRLQVAKGDGPQRPIATNQTSWGRDQNRRVIITFRSLVD